MKKKWGDEMCDKKQNWETRREMGKKWGDGTQGKKKWGDETGEGKKNGETRREMKKKMGR